MIRIDTSISWPPPDPDRMTRSEHRVSRDQEFIRDNEMASDQDRLDSFRQRQNQDLKRFDDEYSAIARRRIVHDYESGRQTKDSDARSTNAYRIQNGVEGWQDSEGDRLDDFGVDEEIEFYDEDEVPLAEILRRRNAKSANG